RDVLPDDWAQLGGRAGKRQAEAVENGLLPEHEDVLRDVLVFRCHDELGHIFREARRFRQLRAGGGPCGPGGAERQPCSRERRLEEIAANHLKVTSFPASFPLTAWP